MCTYEDMWTVMERNSGAIRATEEKMFVCSVFRTRALPGCGATGRLAFEFSRKEVKKMKRSQIKSKLAKIISKLDEIICAETEQTDGLVVVKKCRDDLQKVLVKLNTRRKPLDPRAVMMSIYRLIECVHFFIYGKN